MPKKSESELLASQFLRILHKKLTAKIQETREEEKAKISQTQPLIVNYDDDDEEKEFDASEWAEVATEMKSPVRGLEMALALIQEEADKLNLTF